MASDTVTLTRGATSITIRAPVPGTRDKYARHQALYRTDAGSWVCYDKGATDHEAELWFVLTMAQRDALVSFLDNTIVWGCTTFAYTDQWGKVYATCRIVSPQCEPTVTPGGQFELALLIDFGEPFDILGG